MTLGALAGCWRSAAGAAEETGAGERVADAGGRETEEAVREMFGRCSQPSSACTALAEGTQLFYTGKQIKSFIR